MSNPIRVKYDVSFVPGKLIVGKFPLILVAVSDSKTYDGKALVNLHLQANKLANPAHALKVEFAVFDKDGKETEAIEVGIYEKRITGYTINNSADDVCSNYDVKLVNGTLTVIDAVGANGSQTTEKTDAGRWLGVVVATVLLAGILGYMYFRNRKVNKAK